MTLANCFPSVALVATLFVAHLQGAEGVAQPTPTPQRELEEGRRVLSSEEAKRDYRRQMEMNYESLTGRAANFTNLMESLRSPRALERFKDRDESRLPPALRGRKGVLPYSVASLVVCATLTVLETSEVLYPEATNDVLRCYKESTDWLVKLRCAEVLARYGNKEAVHKFAHEYENWIDELEQIELLSPKWEELENSFTALDRLIHDGFVFPEMTNAIYRCYRKNNSYGNIRSRCATAMEAYDKVAADRLRREEMRYTDNFLDKRLDLAKTYLDEGDPYGYPVLREGLLLNDRNYDCAFTLLNGFRKFDGKPYDQTGMRIDLKALAKETTATNDLAEIRFRKEHKWKRRDSSDPALLKKRSEVDIASKRHALWWRLVCGRVYLEESGWLFGYAYLREGMLSRDDYTRGKALNLAEAFKKYDGQPYNDAGDKIDIQSLLRERKTP